MKNVAPWVAGGGGGSGKSVGVDGATFVLLFFCCSAARCACFRICSIFLLPWCSSVVIWLILSNEFITGSFS